MERTEAARPPAAARWVLHLPPEEIAYVHAILEGYDDLAVMRTLSPAEGLVEAYPSPGREEELRELLAALRGEGVAVEERAAEEAS